MRLADRITRLGGEGMGAILAQVSRMRAEGRSVIPMHAGEPDFDTPDNIVSAALDALRDGQTHYTPAAGIPALRQAVARYVGQTRSIPVDPSQVIVVPGAKPMIYFAMLALCQHGDEVICPNPLYPFYASLAEFVGATAVPLPTTMDAGFGLDLDLLRSLITGRTRIIVLNSPANPTGTMLDRAELEAVASLALEHDLWVLSDEIYSRIVHDRPFESVISIPGMVQRTVLIDGFSKTYAMTGWRLGYGIVPRELASVMTSLMLNTLSCSVSFIQPAAIEALQGPQDAVTQMAATFRRRRDCLVEGVNRIPGLACLSPAGAFYVFARADRFGLPSFRLSEYLLSEAGVATYPGSAFGQYGEGFLRLSFACSESAIEEGLARIRDGVSRL